MFPGRAIGELAALLYPAHCRSCGTGLGPGGGFFCADCISGMKRIDCGYCGVCALPFPDGSGGVRVCSSCMKEPPPFAYARAAYVYSGAVKDAIHLYKYAGMRAMEGFLSGS